MFFKRKIKLFPGVHLNFSKSGISTTIGVRGASVNIGQNGVFFNAGGAGRYKIDTRSSQSNNQEPVKDVLNNNPQNLDSLQEIGAIQSGQAEAITTDGLQELKKNLLDCYQEQLDLKKEIVVAQGKLSIANILLIISYILIFGIFIKWFKENKNQKQEYLADLENQLKNCFIDIDINLDSAIENEYQNLLESYKIALSSDIIWDITSSQSIDKKATRSSADAVVTRKQVKFGFKNMDIIKSKYNALHFENANGGDIYIYPAFIAIVDAHKKFGLIDIRELKFNFIGQRFLEEEQIARDAQVVGKTWAKVNKNGTPDKRFADNYEIPICLYGEFLLETSTGLNEAYSLSSYEKAAKFANAMVAYQEATKSV